MVSRGISPVPNSYRLTDGEPGHGEGASGGAGQGGGAVPAVGGGERGGGGGSPVSNGCKGGRESKAALIVVAGTSTGRLEVRRRRRIDEVLAGGRGGDGGEGEGRGAPKPRPAAEVEGGLDGAAPGLPHAARGRGWPRRR